MEKLIKQYQDTLDDALFEKILTQYEPMINLLTSKYKNNFWVEDLKQDLRLLLFECLKRFDSSKKFKFITYFTTSAIGHVKRRWAMYEEHNPWQDSIEKPVMITFSIDGKESKMAMVDVDMEQVLDCQKMLDGLNSVERYFMEQYFYEGKTYQQIADDNNITATTAFNQIQKIITKLQKAYKN